MRLKPVFVHEVFANLMPASIVLLPVMRGTRMLLEIGFMFTHARDYDGDRANGSIRFEINAPPNAGLAFGIQLLQVVSL